jgi:hypothetical protein
VSIDGGGLIARGNGLSSGGVGHHICVWRDAHGCEATRVTGLRYFIGRRYLVRVHYRERTSVAQRAPFSGEVGPCWCVDGKLSVLVDLRQQLVGR